MAFQVPEWSIYSISEGSDRTPIQVVAALYVRSLPPGAEYMESVESGEDAEDNARVVYLETDPRPLTDTGRRY